MGMQQAAAGYQNSVNSANHYIRMGQELHRIFFN